MLGFSAVVNYCAGDNDKGNCQTEKKIFILEKAQHYYNLFFELLNTGVCN